MRIAEIFYSVQGEGMLVGMPSVFIRTSGCNLRCWYCDTPYTSWQPEGETLKVDAILDQLALWPCKHAVVTGGEPIIAPEIEELCERLGHSGYHITIETAGTIFKPVKADLISLSPKLSNSTPGNETGWAQRHDQLRHQPLVVNQFLENYDCQFKFVIDRPEDVEEVRQYLSVYEDINLDRVFLMPQATDAATLTEKGRWIAELCKRHGFRLGPRLHIDLWGQTRGT
jgi:7-carboxy-7-deazaguanine synthase